MLQYFFAKSVRAFSSCFVVVQYGTVEKWCGKCLAIVVGWQKKSVDSFSLRSQWGPSGGGRGGIAPKHHFTKPTEVGERKREGRRDLKRLFSKKPIATTQVCGEREGGRRAMYYEMALDFAFGKFSGQVTNLLETWIFIEDLRWDVLYCTGTFFCHKKAEVDARLFNTFYLSLEVRSWSWPQSDIIFSRYQLLQELLVNTTILIKLSRSNSTHNIFTNTRVRY